MSKLVSNRLKFLFAGIILIFVLFIVLSFAISFDNKYNTVYWVSFGGGILAVLTSIMFASIALNADKYNNDNCAKKITLFSSIYVVVQMIISIIFMAINSESINSWLPIVISTVLFVIIVFLLIMSLIGSEEE